MKACTAFIYSERIFFSLSFQYHFRGHFDYVKNLSAKKKEKDKQKTTLMPLAMLRHSHALTHYLHYSVFVRVHSESREVKCHVCVLTIGPLQRRISVVRHFRTAITTGLPAVIYFAPNHDF